MDKSISKLFISHKGLWIISIIISLGLLILIIYQLDIKLFLRTIKNLNSILLTIAIMFLILEGITTAIRIMIFSTGAQKLYAALYANAWYVFFLIFLPARLGEIAGIYVLQKHLQQSRGASMMSLVLQRLLDLIILSSIFILLITLSYSLLSTTTAIAIAVLFIAALSGLFKYRYDIITCLALRISNIHNVRKKPLIRVIFRTLLQARIWDKQFSNTKKLSSALLITIFKWIFNLSAITLIFLSASSVISLSDSFLVSVLYNFLAVVPIQTIGGIGIGEAGLTALLTNIANLTVAKAIAISIYTRIIILLFPFLFFILAFSYKKLCTNYIYQDT